MASQVWIGEKPEHPNERRAIVALANGLDRLDGLYLLLANFHVGGRAIDLAIIKRDAIFIIELKYCEGAVTGGVNGPWFIENPGGERKQLNPGRSNPYNQVISYFYSLTNFLNDHNTEFLSEHKARQINFRSSRRVIVIAPTLAPESKIKLDWKVDVKGLDELPAYLVTERSKDLDLTEEEMLAIPRLLGCTRWNDVDTLIAGVMPAWGEEETATAAEPAGTAPAADTGTAEGDTPPLADRARSAFRSFTAPLALVVSIITLVLLLFTVFRPTVPTTSETALPSVVLATSPPAGGLYGGSGSQYEDSCIWSGFQPVGKRWSNQDQAWLSVGVDGTAPVLLPEVVVTLEQVNFCNEQIVMTWSVRNNSDERIRLPLQNENMSIRDPIGNVYTLDEEESDPLVMRVGPGKIQRGVAMLAEPVVQDAPSLLVRLKDEPFGEASWLVSLAGD